MKTKKLLKNVLALYGGYRFTKDILIDRKDDFGKFLKDSISVFFPEEENKKKSDQVIEAEYKEVKGGKADE